MEGYPSSSRINDGTGPITIWEVVSFSGSDKTAKTVFCYQDSLTGLENGESGFWNEFSYIRQLI
jgi:hypothetical protein